MAPSHNDVSRLLADWRDGDQGALDRLMPLVYDELRRMARRYMRGERENHTLQSSALVNEAYMRLADHMGMDWQNRAHFFGVAAQAMRRVLVDHARTRNVQKRGGGAFKVALDDAIDVAEEKAAELVALDDALRALAAFDERKARVVELRYFGGLTAEEAAEVLGVSLATVEREWRTARAWLVRELGGEARD
jgi:RNA polymerase sigma factor (TIGR02999 family)